MTLIVVPLTLAEANTAVRAWHRHHQPTLGHRFSIGCATSDGTLRGAAIIGHPVARMAGHHRDVAEVLRVATDGTQNACSILLGAAARAAKAMGFQRIQTYTLPSEGGASLRAAGWIEEGLSGGGSWATSPRHQQRAWVAADHPTAVKTRWAKPLGRPDVVVTIPVDDHDDRQGVLL